MPGVYQASRHGPTPGPAPGECVKAAAAEAKISERNLIAACDRLEVRTQRGQWWLPG
jgi:hypothetical protein